MLAQTTSQRQQMSMQNITEAENKARAYRKAYKLRFPEKIKQWKRDYRKRKRNDVKFIEKERARFDKHNSKYRSDLLTVKKENGGRCVGCAYSDEIRILHFHHLRDKSFELSSGKRPIEELREEAKKCILLCPNCHAIKHLVKHD